VQRGPEKRARGGAGARGDIVKRRQPRDQKEPVGKPPAKGLRIGNGKVLPAEPYGRDLFRRPHAHLQVSSVVVGCETGSRAQTGCGTQLDGSHGRNIPSTQYGRVLVEVST